MLTTIKNLEDQVKEAEFELQGTAAKFTLYERSLQDKAAEIEEIRNKISKVAELFERKPIHQKYTFEVLCDFITDKAKRLITKYEQSAKVKKGVKDEKSYLYQRKVDALEDELR